MTAPTELQWEAMARADCHIAESGDRHYQLYDWGPKGLVRVSVKAEGLTLGTKVTGVPDAKALAELWDTMTMADIAESLALAKLHDHESRKK